MKRKYMSLQERLLENAIAASKDQKDQNRSNLLLDMSSSFLDSLTHQICYITQNACCSCSAHTIDNKDSDIFDRLSTMSSHEISNEIKKSQLEKEGGLSGVCGWGAQFNMASTFHPVATYVWSPTLFSPTESDRKCNTNQLNTFYWPTHTSRCCWWDCHTFSWTPFPLPIKLHETCRVIFGSHWSKEKWIQRPELYDIFQKECDKIEWKDVKTEVSNRIEEREWILLDSMKRSEYIKSSKSLLEIVNTKMKQLFNDNKILYDCIGCFCGPSCALAYAISRGYQNCKGNILAVAKMFGYFNQYNTIVEGAEQRLGIPEPYLGRYRNNLKPAPPRELLTMFSGEGNGLSIEEFRDLCSKGVDVKIQDKAFITSKQLTEAVIEDQDHTLKQLSIIQARYANKEQKKHGNKRSPRAAVRHVDKLEDYSKHRIMKTLTTSKPPPISEGSIPLSIYTKK